MTTTAEPVYVADFGPGLIFERRQCGRRPFTHAVLMPKAAAGPRTSAAFFHGEEQARLRAGKRGRVVEVTVKTS